MIFEVWRSDESGTIIEGGDGRTRAMEMQEPNMRLVRRIESQSWDDLKPRIDEELHAVRADDLNIPASEFQIGVYPNGVCSGDVFEVKKSYRIEILGAGSVPSAPVGTLYRVVEGDIECPDLVVMRCVTDELSQFHVIPITSHEWSNLEKQA